MINPNTANDVAKEYEDKIKWIKDGYESKLKTIEAETIEKARLYVDSPEFYVLSRERRADAMAEKLRSSNGYN